ncbi:hypothetical protein METBIDRAFT_32938 [Metschnikowia bicuspidata var. bicuspidata NRRL YB-4993]|uniref:Uncharacterized protein n=1 Tax=Metschnikowia bicuspidata var. bicuspidata NRRL YB-4993 TaxID=869754 RepID=A0A1A0H7N7_9ASCO|nr:hypothetical protein METBIDRAFT_32938 [Metschnikowia bicuspidata var. bicuspidata NRRL YB-4993]OBA19913.1 hypothetical protein METBIDRAFT_32938 [Metschnikowia bicuspidata var. bicuspidata NRRL YB-4993]
MSGIGGKAFSIIAVGAIGWYTGVKFWRPLIIEQLEKDNNLDKGLVPPEYVDDAPKNWEDVKSLWKTSLHPEQHPLDVRGAEQAANIASSELAKIRENGNK